MSGKTKCLSSWRVGKKGGVVVGSDICVLKESFEGDLREYTLSHQTFALYSESQDVVQ